VALIAILFLWAVSVALASCAIRVSARLLRARVRWSHAMLFGLIIFALSLAGQGVSARSGVVLGAGLGLLLELAIGAWFFSERGRHASTGEAIGWVRGGVLVGLAQAMMAAVGIALILLVQIAGR